MIAQIVRPSIEEKSVVRPGKGKHPTRLFFTSLEAFIAGINPETLIANLPVRMHHQDGAGSQYAELELFVDEAVTGTSEALVDME